MTRKTRPVQPLMRDDNPQIASQLHGRYVLTYDTRAGSMELHLLNSSHLPRDGEIVSAWIVGAVDTCLGSAPSMSVTPEELKLLVADKMMIESEGAEKVITISTAHFTEEVAKLLNAAAGLDDTSAADQTEAQSEVAKWCVDIVHVPHGYMILNVKRAVYLGNDPMQRDMINATPKCVNDVCMFVHRNGYQHVILDCDGSFVPSLEKYDW